MKFIDHTEIFIAAGDGGNGMVSFHTAHNQPKLGADGGNGGNGGDVLFIADSNLNTLSSLRYRQWYKAEHGVKGLSNNKTGRCGKAKEIKVPCGTVIYDEGTDLVIGEVMQHGDTLLAAKGGKRGYGNKHFLLPTRQQPQIATKGQPGEQKTVRLELKLIADVGLAGFPNAGKSTLLSSLSAARPKVANYPFTTLTPQLGVVDVGESWASEGSLVVADIPGLIEGASEGKGLGHEFLRHIERTQIIAMIIDGFDEYGFDPVDCYQKLDHELTQYSQCIADKKRLVVVNKIDLCQDEKALHKLKDKLTQFGHEVLFISGATRDGLQELKYKLHAMVLAQKSTQEPETSKNPLNMLAQLH